MSTKCQKNVEKMSRGAGAEHAIFGNFLSNFCLFGPCFFLVTLSNARPLQRYSLGKDDKAPARSKLIFSHAFREGIPFLNFVERSILKLSLSKLYAVPFALHNRALLEGVASKEGEKEKKDV